MFSHVYHFLKGPNPLHPSMWGRLRPLTFRRFAVTDMPRCLELYALNEAGRFPEGFIEEYKKTLREQTSYFLVAEIKGQIIASGGVGYLGENTAVFCFGLVRPSHHGRGVGTALLLARLALLNPKRPAYQVVILAVEKSFDYYKRFGFRNFTVWPDIHGQKHPCGRLRVTCSEIRRCRELLRKHGIVVPQDEDQIPSTKVLQSETRQSRCQFCREIINAFDDVCKSCGRPLS
jgi:N-acetylglutamate synthase-like GNAT family acetyltransferase